MSDANAKLEPGDYDFDSERMWSERSLLISFGSLIQSNEFKGILSSEAREKMIYKHKQILKNNGCLEMLHL